VADHQMYLKKLQKFAPEATQEGCLDASKEEAKTEDRKPVQQADATDDATTEKTIEQTAGKRDTDTTRGKFAQAQIERELAQQCLMSSKAVLEEKSGPEFDKCFVGQQIAKHMGMRDKLIVYQRHASAELSEVFAAGQKKTEEHLAMAKDLMKSLEQASSSAK
ncbi:MAG: hypothetical protein JWM11_1266, partial [Planctomycetaceae bacterium]|nr:hypothetical protein [Planctomycetaceae bacterium]